MRTIGLLGGMSWSSTMEYYRIINEEVSRRLGGLHSAKVLLNSVDFDEIVQLQRRGDWHTAGKQLAAAAQALECAGADFVLICANTMHKVSEAVRQAIRIPIIHVADVTAETIKRTGITRVGLLGTLYTMEQDFLKEKFAEYGLQVIIPDEERRHAVHHIIFEELCKGTVSAASRRQFLSAIDHLAEQGAEGVIFGCTEISMLLEPKDSPLPAFDTARIHAESAVRMALT